MSSIDMANVLARRSTMRDHIKINNKIRKNFDKIEKLEKKIVAEHRPEKPDEFSEWSDRLNILQKFKIRDLQDDYIIDLKVYQEYYQNEQIFAKKVFSTAIETYEYKQEE